MQSKTWKVAWYWSLIKKTTFGVDIEPFRMIREWKLQPCWGGRSSGCSAHLLHPGGIHQVITNAVKFNPGQESNSGPLCEEVGQNSDKTLQENCMHGNGCLTHNRSIIWNIYNFIKISVICSWSTELSSYRKGKHEAKKWNKITCTAKTLDRKLGKKCSQ